jgi:hypothetical protein
MSDASTHASISGGGQRMLLERSANSRDTSPFEIEEVMERSMSTHGRP